MQWKTLPFLGLGKVGALAARLLHGAGFSVTGYDVRKTRQTFPFEVETADLGDVEALTPDSDGQGRGVVLSAV